MNIITIDGKRGTGKSALGRALSVLFECEIYEMGPLFRFIAWRSRSEKTTDLHVLMDRIEEDLGSGRLRIRPNGSCNPSNNHVEYDSSVLDQVLWKPELDDTIRLVSNDAYIIGRVCCCMKTLAASGPAIVIGREAGARCFPEARVKIELLAPDQTRLTRKLAQSGTIFQPQLDQSEPSNVEPPSDGTISVDTTSLGPERVLEIVVSAIVTRLGWKTV
jgi:cytidylate kinase